MQTTRIQWAHPAKVDAAHGQKTPQASISLTRSLHRQDDKKSK
jgi:hypothetical protein